MSTGDGPEQFLYSHTQHRPRALVAVVGTLGLALIVVTLITDPSAGLILATVAVPIWILITAFASLTVEVDDDVIHLRYRWGWPEKTIKRSRVSSHAVVRNRWYHGLGIRWIGNGLLWNVWGLDAVELELMPDASENYIDQPKRRRRFRIGTDDPEGLERALRM